MTDSKLIEIGYQRDILRNDISALLPILNRVTRRYNQEVNLLINQAEAFGGEACKQQVVLEGEVDHCVQQWKDQMIRLGGYATGLWVVKFRSKNGYYSWPYPQTEVVFLFTSELDRRDNFQKTSMFKL